MNEYRLVNIIGKKKITPTVHLVYKNVLTKEVNLKKSFKRV